MVPVDRQKGRGAAGFVRYSSRRRSRSRWCCSPAPAWRCAASPRHCGRSIPGSIRTVCCRRSSSRCTGLPRPRRGGAKRSARRRWSAYRRLPGVGVAKSDQPSPDRGRYLGPAVPSSRAALVREPARCAEATFRVVYPGYFATMRLPMLRGRDVAETDRVGAPQGRDRRTTSSPGVTGLTRTPIGKRVSFNPAADDGADVVLGASAWSRTTCRSDWTAPPEEEVFLPYSAGAGLPREQRRSRRVT